SATLSDPEVERLFTVMRGLRARGLGIVYISHRLEEIFAVADRVTVLRDGRTVATSPVAGLDRAQLIRWMVGRELTEEFPPRAPGHPVAGGRASGGGRRRQGVRRARTGGSRPARGDAVGREPAEAAARAPAAAAAAPARARRADPRHRRGSQGRDLRPHEPPD